MLTKFLIAVVVFIAALVILDTAEAPHPGLIALAIGIVAFIYVEPRINIRRGRQ